MAMLRKLTIISKKLDVLVEENDNKVAGLLAAPSKSQKSTNKSKKSTLKNFEDLDDDDEIEDDNDEEDDSKNEED